MTEEEVKEYLCYYDQRNPNYTDGERKEDCYCDNCFYRRDELAQEILRLREKLKES